MYFEAIVVVCILMPCFEYLIFVCFLFDSGAIKYYFTIVYFTDAQTEEEYAWIQPVQFFSFILPKQYSSVRQGSCCWRALCIQVIKSLKIPYLSSDSAFRQETELWNSVKPCSEI